MDSNQRTCHVCERVVTHKNEKDALKAASSQTPCSKCKYLSRKKPTLLSCPKCVFSTKRKTSFAEHVSSEHGTDVQRLWDETNAGPKLCACGCGNVTSFVGWSEGYNVVVVGHNANLVAVHGEEKAREISDKRRAKLVGQVGWASGLTKETDERVAARAGATSIGRKEAFAIGKITPWAKGLTKETDSRINSLAAELSSRYATGELVPWAKGLTKDSDERIKAMAFKVSMAHQSKNLRNRLDEIKRLKFDEIKERVERDGRLRVIDTDGLYVNDATRNIIVECTKCSLRFNDSLRRLQRGRCYACDPGGSKAQHEIAAFIRSLGETVESNCRSVISPQELDIYVPIKKFAVEYNGLYWHNINQKSSSYHQNKSDACSNIGISLFHVFEDEWRDKRPIVESMIRHKLGMTSNKVAARKCAVRKLSVKERQDFFSENHIDGDTNAKLAIGLFHNNQVVSAISLRAPFHKKHNSSLEVARMCSKLNCVVQGALSRLTKAAATETKALGYDNMLTYVDARFGGVDSWPSSGWTKNHETPPRFWWTDDVNRFNRFKYRADSKNGLTEEQVASSAGVVKIFGCKNLCYSYQ